jgi:O-methyltransferase involved in polyketide biosynthesis
MAQPPTGEDPAARVPADLRGVPETLLWNLFHRSVAARDPGTLADPKAVELVERIDYPFDRWETRYVAWAARWHASRVRTFDEEIERFLARHPAGTVVALGEGLETTFWRVDDGRAHWVTVDVEEALRLRRRLLPDGPRQRTVPASALDERWMDELDPTELLVTAQGLLMYFDAQEVDALLERCARRLPGAALLFDAIPVGMVGSRDRWADDASQAPWLWGLDRRRWRELAGLPGVVSLSRVPRARGGGAVLGVVLPLLRRVPGVRDRLPELPVLLARFAAGPDVTSRHGWSQ